MPIAPGPNPRPLPGGGRRPFGRPHWPALRPCGCLGLSRGVLRLGEGAPDLADVLAPAGTQIPHEPRQVRGADLVPAQRPWHPGQVGGFGHRGEGTVGFGRNLLEGVVDLVPVGDGAVAVESSPRPSDARPGPTGRRRRPTVLRFRPGSWHLGRRTRRAPPSVVPRRLRGPRRRPAGPDAGARSRRRRRSFPFPLRLPGAVLHVVLGPSRRHRWRGERAMARR